MRSFFLIFLIILALFALFGTDHIVLAQEPGDFDLFPGEEQGINDFRFYIQQFYRFAIPAGILVATVLIMIGGVIWITSAGEQNRIAKAKEYIINSVIGVILLMGAYVILGFINPNLVNLQPIQFEALNIPGACVPPGSSAPDQSCIDYTQEAGLTRSVCINDYNGTEQSFFPGRTCDDAVAKSQAQEEAVKNPKKGGRCDPPTSETFAQVVSSLRPGALDIPRLYGVVFGEDQCYITTKSQCERKTTTLSEYALPSYVPAGETIGGWIDFFSGKQTTISWEFTKGVDCDNNPIETEETDEDSGADSEGSDTSDDE